MLGFTTNYFLHIKFASYNPLIGKLHNAMSLREQEYYGHMFIAYKCCGEKNIRVKDIFFWDEQYLHGNVGSCE
jgi:hypothetical protein